MDNKIYELSDNDFTNLVKSCLNISEVLFKLGYTTTGNSWGYSLIRRRMEELGLSGKTFRGKEALIKKSTENKIDSKKLLCTGSKHNRSVLKRFILKNKLLPYNCAICGIKRWKGKELSLELDHINGINNDNRLENLRFLCPNCHSQTITYGARNSNITEGYYEVNKELQDLIINAYIALKSMRKVSRKYNINLKAVRQVLSENGLTKPNQHYVIQYDLQGNELNRFGSIAECCNWLMENNIVRTRLIKTCRNTLLRNVNKSLGEYYFKILDA